MIDPVQPEPAPKDKLNFAKWTILILVALVVSISFASVWLFPKQEDVVVAPQFASSKATEIPDVVARAWYPSNRVVQGQEFIVEFELENRSDDDVRDIAITDLPTGSAFAPPSWSKWDGEQLRRLANTKSPRMDVLGKHTSARYQCKLRPIIGSGSYALMAVYAFSTPQGVRTHSAVTLGPFHVVTAWRGEFQNLAAAIQTVLPTIILPISLGLLAWYLPHLASSREQQRASYEQTWNLLLPDSLRASQKYYLQACSAISGLLFLHAEWRKEKSEERRHAVMHALMMFWRHMGALRDELGGLHFKDRAGESAAASCYIILHKLLLSRFSLRTKDAVLDVLEPRESFGHFCDRFDNYRTRGAFMAADEILRKWLEEDWPTQTFGDYLPLFSLFRAILRYEVNRPLALWYGSLEDSGGVRESWYEVKKCWHRDASKIKAAKGTEGFSEIADWADSIKEIENYVNDLPKGK